MLEKKVIIFDATNVAYRSFHASKTLGLSNSKWEPTGVIFLFLKTLEKIKREYETNNLIFCFDTKSSKIRRKNILKEYKENREHKDEEPLFKQIEELKEILTLAWYDVLENNELEADDIVYTIALNTENDFDEVLLVSNDKDYYQMINNKISILRYQGWEIFKYGKQDFLSEYWEAIDKEKFAEMKIISWDASDNIKWIFKLGIKGAYKILDTYWSIENWFNNKEGYKLLPKWLREKVSDFENWSLTEYDESFSSIKEKLEANKKVLSLIYSEEEQYFPTSLFQIERDEEGLKNKLDYFAIKKVSI